MNNQNPAVPEIQSTAEKTAVASTDGLTPPEHQRLAEFKKTMTERVIPEIEKVVEERRLSAAVSREWQLKC